MKTLKYITTVAAMLLLVTGCAQKETPSSPGGKKEKADPELTVSGAPTAAVEAGTSFTLTIGSKSEGAVRIVTDKPAQAGVRAKSATEYEVSVFAIEDTKVTVNVSQEASGDYSAATKDFDFKIKGIGKSAIPGPNDSIEGTKVTFKGTSSSIVNPERGLYSAHEVHSDKDSPLQAGDVRARRSTGHSLLLLEFYLTDYINGNLSPKYIRNIQASLDAMREGGCKAIVRFAYTQDQYADVKDADVEHVLKHIEQLKPTLQKYEDVIFVLQAGFVGVWGEWYYTSHFIQGPKSANDYAPRKKVTDALLAALPESRQIELRTPKFKMMMYGMSLKDTLTSAKAHDGSLSSRLAGHNDCFGASANDQGTFDGDDTREFWKKETRYTIMGGETCAVSEFCLCPRTLQDLQDYHWTYLHDGYNQDVLNRWKRDGCFSEIEENLGYRLILDDVHYGVIEAGKPCKITIRLYNNGYAAPMNPREAWLVWKGSDGKMVRSPLGYDPREWHTGYNAVVSSFTPSTDKGTLYLELSDPLLPDRPDFSIAFANSNVFNAKTGLNQLFEIK
jgi:hypothetical protein